MNREETKKKLVEELKKGMAPIEYGGGREHAPEVHYPSEEEIDDALIAAGLRFCENLTATFDLMALERYYDLERRLAEAEHRAEVAERALLRLCDETMQDVVVVMYPKTMKQVKNKQELFDYCMEQAEKELQEERKE